MCFNEKTYYLQSLCHCLYSCYSTVTCKVKLNWPHGKLGQYCAYSLPNLGEHITRRLESIALILRNATSISFNDAMMPWGIKTWFKWLISRLGQEGSGYVSDHLYMMLLWFKAAGCLRFLIQIYLNKRSIVERDSNPRSPSQCIKKTRQILMH